jgi:FRG domain
VVTLTRDTAVEVRTPPAESSDNDYDLIMPTDLRIERIETLRQYMERIEGLMAADDGPLWYRGAGTSSRALVPSLYRHPTVTKPRELMALEAKILQRFRERSIPYQPTRVEEEWDMLFLMQHFGVPTRLLDWTENPNIGLFFALTGAKVDHATGLSAEPAAVWVLKPESWNRHALSHISYDGGILSMGTDPLDNYRPSTDPTSMPVSPVAMYGLHNSPRIVAQRGVFTIFGKDTKSMDDTYAANDYPADTLIKFEFAESAVQGLQKSLFSIGVTDSVVFPDLAGLALELKRFFGFRV